MVGPLRIYFRRACISLFVVFLSVGLAWTKPKKTSVEPSQSLVAIGDVHGDFDDFVAILQHIGLIDKQDHWTGGKTTLVQVGDILDRGPKPRQVMDLLMALESEAGPAGGRVVSLLGNHEMMNIMGDLRYVTPVNFASFADSDSEKRQKSAYEEYAKWRNKHPELVAELPQPMELTEAEWMARHPLGYVEQREAFSPKGEYGKWLRGHYALAEIGGEIFLHGGIHPDLARMKVDALNSRIRDEIKQFDTTKQYLQDEGVILPFFNMQEIIECGSGRSHRRAQVAGSGKPGTPGQNPGSSEVWGVVEREARRTPMVSGLRPVERQRRRGADRQDPGRLQGSPYCGRTYRPEERAYPASFWKQGVPDRHRHAQQLLPRREGVSPRNLRRCRIYRQVYGPAGSTDRRCRFAG